MRKSRCSPGIATGRAHNPKVAVRIPPPIRSYPDDQEYEAEDVGDRREGVLRTDKARIAEIRKSTPKITNSLLTRSPSQGSVTSWKAAARNMFAGCAVVGYFAWEQSKSWFWTAVAVIAALVVAWYAFCRPVPVLSRTLHRQSALSRFCAAR